MNNRDNIYLFVLQFAEQKIRDWLIVIFFLF